jgi:hypothetical protein
VVTLKDDPEFLPAIHCMVSYFYNDDYDASEHDVHEPLLHAQVTVIADKYDCASLFKYARDSLAESMSVVVCHEWVDVAALIQEYATTDGSAHLTLRDTLLYAVPRDPVGALKFLHDEHVSGFLRSNADLATDILLYRLKKFALRSESEDHIFHCGICGYSHIGPKHCPRVDPFRSKPRLPPHPNQIVRCPQCNPNRTYHLYHRGGRWPSFEMLYPCTACDGAHTKNPAAED